MTVYYPLNKRKGDVCIRVGMKKASDLPHSIDDIEWAIRYQGSLKNASDMLDAILAVSKKIKRGKLRMV